MSFHLSGQAIDWAQVGKVLLASIPPLVLLITTYIAVMQFLINRRQYRLALFEKRLAVFDSTMRMIASVVKMGKADLNECFQFMQETRHHELLFGPEVSKFINEVYHKAVELYAQIAPGDAAAQRTEILTWFVAQMKQA